MLAVVFPLIKTTASLILICTLGVSGVIDTITVMPCGLMVAVPISGASTFGGVIFAGDVSDYDILHESGHLIQERNYGMAYNIFVAVPSLISATLVSMNLRNRWRHMRMYFEREATALGNQ